MKGFLALSENFRGKSLQVGDLVRLELLIEESLESQTLAPSDPNAAWIDSGSFTIELSKWTRTPSDSGTKYVGTALINKPGKLTSEAFVLLDPATNKEIQIEGQDFSQEIANPIQGEEKPQWILPPLPFGSWNYITIGLAILIALSLLAFLVWAVLKKRSGKAKKNHREIAMKALQELQKQGKWKQGMQQAEWKRFSFSLASLLRKFLEENYQADFSDLTDRELISELRLRPKAKGNIEILTYILSTIDEVRYGKKDLDSTLVPGLLGEASKYIEVVYIPKEQEK